MLIGILVVFSTLLLVSRSDQSVVYFIAIVGYALAALLAFQALRGKSTQR
ncbi:hypothetical protein ACFW4Q_31215 [Streptomyces rochei]